MAAIPTGKVSIRIGGDNQPQAQAVLSQSSAHEQAGRDVAGIIQELKLLKHITHNIVDIKDVEAPQTKKRIIDGVAGDYSGILPATFDIQLSGGLKEVSIPVTKENMKRIREVLHGAVNEAGKNIRPDEDIMQTRETTSVILGNLQNGLENITKPALQHQALRK